MHPILFESNFFVLPAWHLFFMVGVMTAYWTFLQLAENKISHIHRTTWNNLFLASYLGGYWGARYLSLIFEEGAHPFISLFSAISFGPMTFYGGALGGILWGSVYVLWKKLPYQTIFNFAVPTIFIGLFWGRIGCFLNGCDYGIPISDQTQIPFYAVTFPTLADGIYRHPVQLYEAFFSGLLAIYFIRQLIDLPSNKISDAAIGMNSILAYAVLRFLMEFLRGDERGHFFLDDFLSPSQFLSLLIIFSHLTFYQFFNFRNRRKTVN